MGGKSGGISRHDSHDLAAVVEAVGRGDHCARGIDRDETTPPVPHKAMQPPSRIAVCADDLAAIVDVECVGSDGARDVDRFEPAPLPHEAVVLPVVIDVIAHHLTVVVDADGLGEDGARCVDSGEAAVVQEKPTWHGVRGLEVATDLAVGPHDLAPVVDARGSGRERARHVEAHEPAASVPQEPVLAGRVVVLAHDSAALVDAARQRLGGRARHLEGRVATFVEHEPGDLDAGGVAGIGVRVTRSSGRTHGQRYEHCADCDPDGEEVVGARGRGHAASPCSLTLRVAVAVSVNRSRS
jgi:hypothetical protein